MLGTDGATPAWPLSDEQRVHVSRLAEYIKRFGAGRFLNAHLVRADEQDFPDKWEPTLRSLYRLLYRLFWHAHISNEVEIDDLRGTADPSMLTNSSIDFIAVENGRAQFQVAAFGNDDIAGLVSHTVGEAFLALAPVDPFRAAAPAAPTEAESTLAASFLGLGVLVANSSMYRRYKSRLAGREVLSEQRVERTGGLSISDATLVLAIQLTVRDDVPGAKDTLLGPQKDWIDRWLAVLDPHEDELRRMLGLDDADHSLPERPTKPREAPDVAEPTLAVRNEGLRMFRVPKRRHRFWLGLLAGFAAIIALRLIRQNDPGPTESIMLVLLLPIGAIGGFLIARPGFRCFACKQVMATELPTCPSCRITLDETLDREQQKARLAEWAAEREEVDPEHAAEAENAYHPDV